MSVTSRQSGTGSDLRRRIAAAAARQAGVLHWRQLRELGASSSTIGDWVREGYLFMVMPKVYAVGHPPVGREASLWAAVLYAGPGAMLSHTTAGHLIGIVDRVPWLIEVSTPRRVKPVRGVKLHCRRSVSRVRHKRGGLPTTTIEQAVLDIAASASRRVLNRALAQLDFQHRLRPAELDGLCHRGALGSDELLSAMAEYLPQSSRTNMRFEQDFLEGCAQRGIPLPEFNRDVAGIQTDAYWAAYALVVELDGLDNHCSPAQVQSDRQDDMVLRRAGLTVIRYAWTQVHGVDPSAYEELEEWFASWGR